MKSSLSKYKWIFLISTFLVFFKTNTDAIETREPETFKVSSPVELAPGEISLFHWNPVELKLEKLEQKQALPLSEKINETVKEYPDWLHSPLVEKITSLGFSALSGNRIYFARLEKKLAPEMIVMNNNNEFRVFTPPEFIYEKSRILDLPEPEPADVAFADFNGDNLDDMILLQKQGKLLLYFGSDFSSYSELFSVENCENVTAGDLDGDKTPELIITVDAEGKKEIRIFKMRTDRLTQGRNVSFFLWKNLYEEKWKNLKVRTAIAPVCSSGACEIYVTLEDGSCDLFSWDCTSDNWIKTSSFKTPLTNPYAAWGDVDGDEIPDLVMAGDEDDIFYWKGIQVRTGNENSGAQDFKIKPFFYDKNSELLFKDINDYAPAPCLIDLNGDGKAELLVGCKNGSIKIFSCTGDSMGENRDFAGSGGFLRISAGDMDGDKEPEIVIGTASGEVIIGKISSVSDLKIQEKNRFKIQGSYAAPSVIDLNGDGNSDLLIGTKEGDLLYYLQEKDEVSGKKYLFNEPSIVNEIEKSPFTCPAAGDFTGDGIPDLVIGDASGKIKFFQGYLHSPVSNENKIICRIFFKEIQGFSGIDVGEFSTPFLYDIDSDQRLDLITGNAGGKIFVYEIGTDKVFEKYSWEFEPQGGFTSLEDYYDLYIQDYRKIMSFNSPEIVEKCIEFLKNVQEPYKDEVGFSLAHLPDEIIRTMFLRNEEDILLDNAKQVYKIASKLSYVKIIEKHDSTTVSYDLGQGKMVECPSYIYYWWIVHPRIIYELPARIDVSYWSKSPEFYGQDQDEWLIHEPEPSIYSSSPFKSFWRSTLPNDARYGTSLLEAVSPSKTFREAVTNLHAWLTWNRQNPFMSFGYKTQDLQPLVIYAKHYGSCGEHSILTAACARAMLIPVRVVGCRGEDHQWNEFYENGEWLQWDMNYTVQGGIDAPWVSGEGMDHKAKTISAITGWRGDEKLLDLTTCVHNPEKSSYTKRGHGYTDTGKLILQVNDRDENPVDGALVILRSHWEKRNLPSIWGYTDTRGQISFEVGYEPEGGYTVEILSPSGSAGSMNLPVEEGKEYFIKYSLPGKKREFSSVKASGNYWKEIIHFENQEILESSMEGGVKNTRGFVSAPMVIGERRKGKDSYLWKEFKYSGVRAGIAELQASDQNIEMRVLQGKKQDLDLKRLTSEPEILNNPNVPKSFPLDQDFTVALINRKTSLVTLKTQMDFIFKSIPAAPQIIIAESGNSFEGEITDNLAVRKLEASFDSGKKFLDITDEVTFSNPMTRVGKFTWEPAASRILPSGNYSIRLRVADFSDNQSQSNDFAFKASPCDRFLHQSVYQDNPDLPFPNSSWSTGPFKVADNLPFFEIRTQGETPGMDIDLYLFEDKNHDGQVNGMEENILKSAGPLSNERIFMENPESSEYFIYVHGFDVPAQGGKFSLFSSEVINSSIAGNRGPTGYLNDSTHKTPLNIFCKYKGISSLDRDKTKFQLNGVDLTEDIIFSDSLISYDISDNLLQNTPYNIMLELGDFCGTDQILEWNFIIDRTPPHLKIIEPVASKKTVSEVICFKVRAYDNNEVTKVKCKVQGLDEIVLTRNSKQMDIFEGQADVLKLPEGQIFYEIYAIDSAQNKTIRQGSFYHFLE